MPRLVLLFGQTSSDDQERLDSRNRAYEGPEPLPKELEEFSMTVYTHTHMLPAYEVSLKPRLPAPMISLTVTVERAPKYQKGSC